MQRTIVRFEALLKNIGAQVDAKGIVQGVQKALEEGINKEIDNACVFFTSNLPEKQIQKMQQETERLLRTNQ